MKDVHGEAIKDHFLGISKGELLLHTSYDSLEEMPVEEYFRSLEEFSDLETMAVDASFGSVLDVGAAAGAFAVVLREKELQVVAMDTSPGCCEVMKQRGLEVRQEDFFHASGKFDTLLMMMNGIGIVGKLDRLPAFLQHCREWVNPGGQVLFDSSDIRYLYEDIPRPEGYFGEIRFQFEYSGEKGGWFDWLYVDFETLQQIVDQHGLMLEKIAEDDRDQYLARIIGF